MYSIHRKLDKIMSAIDDLNVAVTALQTEKSEIADKLSALSAEVETLLGEVQSSSPDTAAVEAAAQNITNVISDLHTAVAGAAS